MLIPRQSAPVDRFPRGPRMFVAGHWLAQVTPADAMSDVRVEYQQITNDPISASHGCKQILAHNIGSRPIYISINWQSFPVGQPSRQGSYRLLIPPGRFGFLEETCNYTSRGNLLQTATAQITGAQYA
jgi:hypothetical protein